MNPILAQIEKIGVLPVIRIDNIDTAIPLVEALAAGGIPCAEITFRTAHGEEAIRRVAARLPETLMGAGTVLNTDQVDRAVEAGAKFAITPGVSPGGDGSGRVQR